MLKESKVFIELWALILEDRVFYRIVGVNGG